MSDHCVLVDDDSDIRQGDVIRRIEAENGEKQTWGFIITADCDIAQSKTGDRFTWLEIIKSDHFLDAYWAPEQLRRLVEKQTKPACDGLNGMIKRSGRELSEVDGPALHIWLSESTPDEIIGFINPAKSPDAKFLANLTALRIALGHERDEVGLARLRRAWTLLGRDEKTQRSAIRDAFDADRGFPDFLLIPELPSTPGYGFVILLRAISTLHATELFKTEVDARINDRPHAFHRIGRFSDGLRFSVAQKLAFLFSRIGMSTQFENACDAVAELLVETIYKIPGDAK